MSKGKTNGKGKAAVSLGEMNDQAFLDEISAFIASLTHEEIVPEVCKTLGMEFSNNSPANEVIRYLIGTSAEAYFRKHSDEKLSGPGERMGRAVRRMAGQDLMTSTGLDFDWMDGCIKRLMQNKEYAEADAQMAAEDDKDIRMSERKEASVEVETPAAPEPKAMVSDKKVNDKGKARFFGAFDSVKDAEAILHLLKTGTPGIMVAISKSDPIGCQGVDCGITLKEHKDVHAALDLVSGKAGLFCAHCAASIAEQNGLVAAGEDAMAGLSEEQSVSITEADLIKAREEFERLSAEEAEANELAASMVKEAESKIMHTENTEAEVNKLQKAVDKGLEEEFGNDLAKAKTNLAAQKKDTADAITDVAEAKELLNEKRDKRVKFSERHAPHMQLIIAGREQPISDDLSLKLSKIGKSSSAATEDDPFPNLKPKDICGCGKTQAQYKNHCGKNAFCDPRNGTVRKAKKGDIHIGEFEARKASTYSALK